VRNGKVLFGFPYPPLSLYLSTLGYAVAGDYRYAQLIALAGAALLITFARRGSWSSLIAILLLFAPRSFFVLCRGWTEPFAVLCLALTIFCALRYRKLLPIALGLLLASKQYLVLALPLVALLVDIPDRWRNSMKLALQAIGVAALVTAPLALLDPQAFWHSLVTVQALSPFREDALSYLVWYFHQTGIKAGVLPAFIAAVVAIALALWRAERSPAGFAASLALVCLLFISLNKQAFANYYSFVIGALWCAMAATPVPAAHPLNETVVNVR
jgi:4-amino-4-deoxy-L-arabinose transferase-like glycosyltransferase